MVDDVPSAITEATTRLLRTLETLPDEEWAAPSVCAGWSRAHVAAHLALNAEGLAGALRGVLDASHRPMYRSEEARDADIEALAQEPPDVVRDRLRAAAATFDDAVAELPYLPADAHFDRVPGGQVVPAARVPFLRLREVEIHHADLQAGYTYDDWPEPVAVAIAEDEVLRPDRPHVVVRATDVGYTWTTAEEGADPPVVSGPVAALAWWLTGRDPGDAVSCSTGELPRVGGR